MFWIGFIVGGIVGFIIGVIALIFYVEYQHSKRGSLNL